MMATSRARKKLDHRTRVGEERSARTELRILEAALRVFGEMGPDAPTIDDFIREADVSRGTFYNYFRSVPELLVAVSEWTTRDIVERIDTHVTKIDDPVVRMGVALRLLFRHATSDRAWCRFVSRVWRLAGIERPTRDLEEGLRRGVLRASSGDAARDLLLGALREALRRLGDGDAGPQYADQMTELCLHALGADTRRIAAAMRHVLPADAADKKRVPRGS